MPSTEIADLRRTILDCAQSEGLAVDAIHEEEVDRVSYQLEECISALIKAGDPTIVVPSLMHLAALGNPLEVRRDFESQGIRVLVANTLLRRPTAP
jgi:hypothetical protein